MELQSWQGPVVRGSSAGHGAVFPDLMHCSVFPKLSPTAGSGCLVWPGWGQGWYPGILMAERGTSSAANPSWKGLGEPVQGKELVKRQTLPSEER